MQVEELSVKFARGYGRASRPSPTSVGALSRSSPSVHVQAVGRGCLRSRFGLPPTRADGPSSPGDVNAGEPAENLRPRPVLRVQIARPRRVPSSVWGERNPLVSTRDVLGRTTLVLVEHRQAALSRRPDGRFVKAGVAVGTSMSMRVVLRTAIVP